MAAWLLRCASTHFDPSAEAPNPFNPIAGRSLLDWLATALEGRVALTPPWPEDWGWASDARCDGARHLVGACCHPAAEGPYAWSIQIEPHRGLVDRLLGRGQMDADDPCLAAVRDALVVSGLFTDVEVERA